MYRRGESGRPGRFRRAFSLEDAAREIDEEIAHHLAMRVSENEAAGMSPEAARSEAVRRFGDVAEIREETLRLDRRLAWRRRWSGRIDRAAGSVRQAWRSMRRHPGLSASIVGILSLGIAAASTMFAMLEGTLLHPLPFPAEERLVKLAHPVPGLGGFDMGTATEAWVHFRENQRTLTDLGLLSYGRFTLDDGGEAESIFATLSTGNLPGILGSSAAVGRLIGPLDPAGPLGDEIVLSHAFWNARFGGDSAVVGRTVTLDGRAVRIVGVLAPGHANLRFDTDAWLAMNPLRSAAGRTFAAIGRLRRGIEPDEAEEDLERLVATLSDASPDVFSREFMSRSGYGVEIEHLRPSFVGPTGVIALWTFLGSAVLLVVACCGNVANLLLARRETRRHETAVRGALGAGRLDFFLVDASEAVLVATAALFIGVGVTRAAVPALVSWIAPSGLPRLDMVSFRAETVLFAVAVSLWAALVVAAIGSIRRSPDELLVRDAWRGSAITRRASLTHFVLAAGQVALAMILVTGAGLTLRSMRNVLGTNTGVSTAGVLTFSLSLPASYDTHGEIVDFQRRLVGDLRGLPGVTAAGAADLLPLAGDGGGDCVTVRTRGAVTDADLPCAVRVTATPGYTESLGMGVRAGTLAWNDPTGVLVTAHLAERLWPGEDPVGRQFTSGDGSATWRVDGVIDVLRPVVLEPPADAIIVPVDGVPDAARLRAIVVTVRTDGQDPLALIPAVRRLVARIEPAVAIANARSMDAVARQATLPYTIIFAVIGFWAAACLLLCVVGTWGVVSHVAGRRTKEIAIRLALGAGPRDLRRAIAGRTFRLTAIGAATGLAASTAATRVLEAMLHGVDPLDPGVFATVAAIVCGSAFVAGWLPARRATHLDLPEALRAD